MHNTVHPGARALALSLMVTLAGCEAEPDEEAALRASEGVTNAVVGIDASAPFDAGADAGGRADAAVRGGWLPEKRNWLSQTVAGSPIFAVTGTGPGCGEGGTAVLSPDGKTLTIAFEAFEAIVSPSQRVAYSSCSIAIAMHSADDYTYSVLEARAQGYAQLASGQSARVRLRHYSSGIPVVDDQLRAALSGPYDGPVEMEWKVPNGDGIWSPCGRDRQLHLNGSVNLRNDASKDGIVSLAPRANNPDAKLSLTFALRSCRIGTVSGARDAGAVSSFRP